MTVMTPDPFAVARPSASAAGDLAPEDLVRRLRWRARRGLLENDLLLNHFFEKWEGRLTVEDHNGLGRLLDLTDNDLLDLLVGREEPDGPLDQPDVHAVLMKIRTA
jgi:antitoxin CptB